MTGKHNISHRDVIKIPLSNNQNQVHGFGSTFATINFSSSSYDLLLAHNFSAYPPINANMLIKLDHNNYIIGKEHMEGLMIAYRLEGFIDKSLPTPTFSIS